jgi:subtilase family serine protease
MMHNPVRSFKRQQVSSVLFALLLCSISLVFSAQATLATSSVAVSGHIGALSSHTTKARWRGNSAPTDAACMSRPTNPSPCYSPAELQTAYDVTPLLKRGINGKGQTIVIVDSFGSPTALQDLKKFDADYALPDPPSFQQLAPLGSVPFNPNNNDQVGWAEETSLDIQWAHAMAPEAGIVVLTSPVSETEGIQGMPQFLQLEQYALDHHLGKIITQSWSTTENTLFDAAGKQQVLIPFERFYQRAAFEHVSVFAASGDSGTANVDVNNKIYPFPTVGYPASSPWVTAVGGTSLYADVSGKYQSEKLWTSSGGGVSQYFSEPFYQHRTLPGSDQKLLKGHRGLPDIAMNADPSTAVPVYLGFLGAQQSGYYLFGGTSESSPLWAGITADANQYAGHPLGFLNPILYSLGSNRHSASSLFHDIVGGNNGQDNIPGYTATPGWDATTGWGSPIVAPLIQALRCSW